MEKDPILRQVGFTYIFGGWGVDSFFCKTIELHRQIMEQDPLICQVELLLQLVTVFTYNRMMFLVLYITEYTIKLQ